MSDKQTLAPGMHLNLICANDFLKSQEQRKRSLRSVSRNNRADRTRVAPTNAPRNDFHVPASTTEGRKRMNKCECTLHGKRTIFFNVNVANLSFPLHLISRCHVFAVSPCCPRLLCVSNTVVLRFAASNKQCAPCVTSLRRLTKRSPVDPRWPHVCSRWKLVAAASHSLHHLAT